MIRVRASRNALPRVVHPAESGPDSNGMPWIGSRLISSGSEREKHTRGAVTFPSIPHMFFAYRLGSGAVKLHDRIGCKTARAMSYVVMAFAFARAMSYVVMACAFLVPGSLSPYLLGWLGKPDFATCKVLLSSGCVMVCWLVTKGIELLLHTLWRLSVTQMPVHELRAPQWRLSVTQMQQLMGGGQKGLRFASRCWPTLTRVLMHARRRLSVIQMPQLMRLRTQALDEDQEPKGPGPVQAVYQWLTLCRPSAIRIRRQRVSQRCFTMRCPRRRALRCRAVRQLRMKVQAVVLLSCLSMTAAHDCQLCTRVQAVVLLCCQSMTAAQDLTSAATSVADTIMSPYVTLRGSTAIPAGRFSLNEWIVTTIAIGLLALLCTMMPAQGGGAGRVHRAPPAWSPEQAQGYPFRTWTQDLQIWSIAHVDIPPAQQAANIIMQLGGAARELVRNMSYDQIANGGMIGGVQQDPVTFLVAQLATNYAPLGEETRLTAMTELMQFRKNQGETIDNLITRFLSTKHRAEVGGVNMVLSVEGYSWILLRACGVTQQQLLSLLQPTNSRFPNTDDEFNALMMSLRRMGHILEGSIGNIASQLRAPPSSSFPTFEASDPWQQGQDPWQNSTASSDAWQNWSGGTAQYGNQQAYPSLAQLPLVPDDDDDDDTATISSDGEADYTGLGGLTPNQIDEHLFWAYDSSRRNWRAHMQRPTRYVRRTIKGKSKGKGRNGKGKGKRAIFILGIAQ